VTYADHFSADTLASELQNELDGDVYLRADPGYLEDYFDEDAETADYSICFSTDGNNLSEFGIWHADNPKTAQEISTQLRRYLDESLIKNKSFYDSYIPEETPKLRDAEVRVFGNYVAYAILDKENRMEFFKKLEEKLTQKG
jgi:hypothetical protein